MTRDPVIKAKELHLTFKTNDGPVHALQAVSLEINKGDFVSFIGPSGCGKTTFLRCIAGLETPTSGEISVNDLTPDEARRARAYGYVFQAAGLYPWRTIESNIRLPLEIMGFSKSEMSERVVRVLELVDLTGFEKKFPWQLSGGMQQRASIARALAFDADILLMDEPFSNLDASLRQSVRSQVEEIVRASGTSTIFVTHDQSLTRFATRIIRLDSGKVVDDEKGGLKSIVNTTKIVAESVVEEAVDGAKKIGSKIKDIAKSIVE